MKRQYYDSPVKAQDMFIEDFDELWEIISDEVMNRTGDFFTKGIVEDITITIASGTELSLPEFTFYHDKNRIEVSAQNLTIDTAVNGTFNLFADYTENVAERDEPRERRITEKKHKRIEYTPGFSISSSSDGTKVKLAEITISGNTITNVDNSKRDKPIYNIIKDTAQDFVSTWSSQKIVNYIASSLASASNPVIDTLNTPPAGPSDDDRYIIGTSPTGDWSGQPNNIAQWNTETDPDAWSFTTATQGMTVYNQSLGYYVVWNGASWERFENTISLDEIPDGSTYSKLARTQSADEINYSSNQLSLSFGEHMYGLGGNAKNITSSTGLDDITETGFYYANTGSGSKPSGADNGHLLHIDRADAKFQLYSPDTNNKIYVRRNNTDVWTSWVDVTQNLASISHETNTGSVTTNHLRQINASFSSEASGDKSQINASFESIASGANSQVNASRDSSIASGFKSQINASDVGSIASGDKSQINASSGSIASGDRSQINASNISIASGDRSQVNVSYDSEVSGDNSQINASSYVKNDTAYSSVWGHGTSSQSINNQTIRLESVGGHAFFKGNVRIGEDSTTSPSSQSSALEVHGDAEITGSINGKKEYTFRVKWTGDLEADSTNAEILENTDNKLSSVSSVIAHAINIYFESGFLHEEDIVTVMLGDMTTNNVRYNSINYSGGGSIRIFNIKYNIDVSNNKITVQSSDSSDTNIDMCDDIGTDINFCNVIIRKRG